MKNINNRRVKTPQADLSLMVLNYHYNSRLALFLVDSNHRYRDLTANLVNISISNYDEGFLNNDINRITYEGCNLIDIIKKLGFIKESYGYCSYDGEQYEYVKFDLDKLKEFDYYGVRDYINKMNFLNNSEIYNVKI